MQLTCPECQIVLDLEDSKAGRKVKCRFCGHKFIAELPNTSKESAVIAPPVVATGEPPSEKSAEVSLPQTFSSTAVQKIDNPFISPMSRATIILIVCAASVVLACISIWSSHSQLDLLHRAATINRLALENPDADEETFLELCRGAGGFVTNEEIEANDTRERTIGLYMIGAFLIFIVTYLMWTYRAYKNLDSLKAQQIRFSPAGAVGWYFCPLLNLWKPCQIMSDTWLGSRPNAIGTVSKSASGFVVLWWLVWVADKLFSQGSFSMMPKEGDPIEMFINSSWMDIYGTIVGITSLLLTMTVIYIVTKRQIERHKNLQIAEGSAEQEQARAEL